MVGLKEGVQGLEYLLCVVVEVDEFLDLQIVGLGDDLIALAEQEGEEGC